MKCPVDGTELRPADYEGVIVFACDSCGGELIPGDEIDSIGLVRDRHVDFSVRGLLDDQDPVLGEDDQSARVGPVCPVCSTEMRGMTYFCDGTIWVDRCTSCHAIWIEPDAQAKVHGLLERWGEDAPPQLRDIAEQLEMLRRKTAAETSDAWGDARFSFVNALVSRVLEAA